MGKKLTLGGMRFGKLAVTGFYGHARGSSGVSKRMWSCVCDCGTCFQVQTGALMSGNTTSCGCAQVAAIKEIATTHGKTNTPEWLALRRVKDRVMNPGCRHFPVYSKRGMEESWKDDFTSFLYHIGPMPVDGQRWSVGRIDNEIGYFEGNVRWETDEQQNRNHSMQSNNTSGVVGVKLHREDGVVDRVVASCQKLNGKRKSCSFSLSKYGYDEAFRLACESRTKMIEDLNTQGAGYAAKHGKPKEIYEPN